MFNSKSITRRNFLKRLSTGALTLSSFETFSKFALAETSDLPVLGTQTGNPFLRENWKNPFVRDGESLLVIVEGKDKTRMLEAGIEALGGIEGIIKEKEAVIKPNFVSPQPYPVTTDPDFAIAIANYLKKAGSKKIIICDAPGSDLYGGKDRKFKFHKMFEKGEKAGVEVIATDSMKKEEFIDQKRKEWEANPVISVNRTVLKAPVIINTVVLKKHSAARMSCSLKNNFGTVLQTLRTNAHIKSSQGEEGMKFYMKTISEFADAVRPDLNIVDANSIMLREHLISLGGEVKTGINKMILGGDMVAIDVYCAKLLEKHDSTFSADMVSITQSYAEKLGLGTSDLSKVKIIEITA